MSGSELRGALSGRLRKHPGFVKLRALQHEGFANAWRRWRLWSRILRTPPTATQGIESGSDVEVHVLCWLGDYLTAIWALKSFYFFSGVGYPLVIHVQGPAPARVAARLRRHFPAARVVLQPEADALVEAALSARGLVRLIEARRRTAFMLKLTDFALIGESEHLLALDADVLFFRRPGELLHAPDGSLFQRDPQSTYNISEEQAAADLGVRLASRINTGIARYRRASVDLDRCDAYLAHPGVARPTGWIEQTLHALVASERGRIEYLPDTYLVSLTAEEPAALVARHYAGPSRPMLTTEGMPALLRSGFMEALERRRLEE